MPEVPPQPPQPPAPRPRRPRPEPEDYSGVERRRPPYDGDRRQEDPNPFAGLPLWSRVIAMVGIPGALAFFLVWVSAGYIPKMYAEMVAIRLENERMRLVAQQQQTQLELNYRLLQRICSNVAKTDEDRQRCFDR